MNHNLVAKDLFSMCRKSHAFKFRFRNPSVWVSYGSVNHMWHKLNRGAP